MNNAIKAPRRAKVWAVGLAAALAAAMLPGAAHAEGEPLVIDKGHVDAFNVHVDKGELKLNLKEDVTGSHVHRDPKAVELHVKSDALTDLPEGIPGSPKGYYLPQVQDHNLLWPGWDTLGIQGTGFEDGIKLHFDKVDGPGAVHLFGQGSFGGIEPLLENDVTELAAGAVRDQSFPAHTHANWVFTKPGVYRVTLHATGVKDGQAKQSNDATYTFTIGDEFKGKGYVVDEPEPEPSPEPTASPSEPAPKPSEEPGPSEEPKPTPTTKPAPKPAPSDQPTAKPSQQPSTTPSKDAPAPKAPKTDATKAPVPGQPGHSQASKSPALQCKPVQVQRKATAAELKAKATPVAGKPAAAGSAKAGGRTVVPANTHVHPNWVFTKPGNYSLTIRQSAKSKSGETLSATATLRFNVGSGASGVQSGHFDFGAQIVDGKLVAKVKDDRKSPAQWVDPSSLTFALGDAAKVNAPAGLEFLAAKGEPVWMSASAQVAGVPWLGANTQHESLLAGTTGDVTFELVSATGPGKVGVFSSGNFGQVVAERWFDYSPAQAAAVPAEPEAPKAEAKADEGTVTETKWQYPNGDPCTPPNMPKSGVSA